MITQRRRSAIYALVAYTLLLVDGEDEGDDEVKETDDDDEGEPSESVDDTAEADTDRPIASVTQVLNEQDEDDANSVH